MSDLVKRLREACANPSRDAMDVVDHWNLEDEAADEIERKDAAIAELVGALRDAIETQDRENRPDRPWQIAGRRVLAKYDIPKDGL